MDNDSPLFSKTKDSTPAAAETVAPEESTPAPEETGVKTGGLRYTENVDGTRSYPDQKPVKTIDDPTPTPEDESKVTLSDARPTSAPVGS